jgi:hypothetical protein
MLGQRLQNIGMTTFAEKHFQLAIQIDPRFRSRRDNARVRVFLKTEFLSVFFFATLREPILGIIKTEVPAKRKGPPCQAVHIHYRLPKKNSDVLLFSDQWFADVL